MSSQEASTRSSTCLERQVAAERVDVRYDPDLGYPMSVRADWIVNAVDDEHEFRISDFTVVTT